MNRDGIPHHMLEEKMPISPNADYVNSPWHYTQGGIECIDAMVSAFGITFVQQWARLNAFKYLWRADKKGGSLDIKKAVWYLRYSLGDDPRKDK